MSMKTVTPRTAEIAAAFLSGMNKTDIAAALGCAARTVAKNLTLARTVGLLPPAAPTKGAAYIRQMTSETQKKPAPEPEASTAAAHMSKLAGILANVFMAATTSLTITAHASGASTIVATSSTGWSREIAATAGRHAQAVLLGSGWRIVRRAALTRTGHNQRPISAITLTVAPVSTLPKRGKDQNRSGGEPPFVLPPMEPIVHEDNSGTLRSIFPELGTS